MDNLQRKITEVKKWIIQFSAYMGVHIVTTGTISNLRPSYHTKQYLTNKNNYLSRLQ